MTKQFWDDRYSDTAYAYGKEPNRFFAEWLQQLKPGSILMPADGEGCNGVYAARLGWKVTSCDLSAKGKAKALLLAGEYRVTLDYLVGDLEGLQFEPATFDAIGLVYAHFPADKKALLHQILNGFLKPGGIIIFEAFSKQHLAHNSVNPKVGGPKELGMLFSKAELRAAFPNYDIHLLEEKALVLEEGQYHDGIGSVVRFIGRKQ
jgi:SAM-dependent methyltransferase